MGLRILFYATLLVPSSLGSACGAATAAGTEAEEGSRGDYAAEGESGEEHQDQGAELVEREPVSCGEATCSPMEYCEIRCTCCGTRIPDPSEASGTYRCVPLPETCRTSNPPECERRTVEIPCA